MWAKYKVMAKCLGGFFLYLDRHVTEDNSATSLNSLSICCFHDMVFKVVYPMILEAALDRISQDRSENSGCSDLLKNASTFFVEIGNGKMHYYDNFEAAILASSADYYSQLCFELLPHYSPVDYIQQAHRCFNHEKERASQFLNQTSVEKLLQ
ncbi:cullin-1-like protein isoform X1, partial [Tanacetum coccineum]